MYFAECIGSSYACKQTQTSAAANSSSESAMICAHTNQKPLRNRHSSRLRIPSRFKFKLGKTFLSSAFCDRLPVRHTARRQNTSNPSTALPRNTPTGNDKHRSMIEKMVLPHISKNSYLPQLREQSVEISEQMIAVPVNKHKTQRNNSESNQTAVGSVRLYPHTPAHAHS